MSQKNFFDEGKSYGVNDYAGFHFENGADSSLPQVSAQGVVRETDSSNFDASPVASGSGISDVGPFGADFHQLQQHVQTPYGGMTMPASSSSGATSVPPEQDPSLSVSFNRLPKSASTKTKNGRIRSSRREDDNRIPFYDLDVAEGAEDDLQEDFHVEGMKTKSGRKIQRPVAYNPNATALKRKSRKVDMVTLCSVCQRGHSPLSNRIVFCDGCNSPYHQLCHHPPIDDATVQDVDAEWFCMKCQYRRAKQPLETGMTAQDLGLSESDKKMYLSSLPTPHLADLILFCEKSYPSLPIYNPRTRELLGEIRHQLLVSSERQQISLQERLHAKQDEAPSDEPAPVPYTASYVANSGTLYDYPTLIRLAIRNTLSPSKDEIFNWLAQNVPLLPTFHDSASEAIRWMVNKGQLVRSGSIYQIATVEEYPHLQPSLLPTFQRNRKVPKLVPVSFPTDDPQNLCATVL
ncbi:PHD finger protein Phf1 [Schizosaccharomyces pombe]|uniref:SWM histone demethylase complex subunit phf1 n=1 Tax=Schizosaccharomyces pombe (strain 972 / ATCC 24843) TaxID=284812 RepID=PHF1_SCHPO|nr:PHD finger domain-containing protein Phf1 [Schizosaccharomyces pombe]P87233.1 RecName: Full=SWM histone demethylase complex subunit phf1; AltName: Full=PHD finger domain-containing protein phf1 [Schizosaccharomyces pombe 972h-]CAB09774.1 PHD finger containing protein Phf1 [Schizosaccharomyces pombe]|eukprot:NP_587831.1 PHD finger domain-containing protein Phf1 [Schizosaccharomyces pombe]